MKVNESALRYHCEFHYSALQMEYILLYSREQVVEQSSLTRPKSYHMGSNMAKAD